MANPVLEITRLGIVRGGTRILRGVDWRVECGEHWVILGANGSGKTSLLAALTGYFTPTTGEIDLLGQRFGESDWRALRTHVGLVSSSIRQMMAETEPALDTVASGRYAMIDFWGTPKRADRVQAARILKQVECAYLAARPWSVLSQGERQRVLIGRALMAKPSLLILDEPCAGLDPVARENFLGFLERLARRRAAPTLVFVTHHVEEITPVFTHALLLRAGRVVAGGPLRKVLTSENISRTLGGVTRLRKSRGRYTLVVAARRGVVV
ncbi:MAG: ABC transporter ATP-binding protein [Verrucomicrobia bacterium]|nr:ABC transporter ATP-binding protein [Verrucomicrobiota bacterium]